MNIVQSWRKSKCQRNGKDALNMLKQKLELESYQKVLMLMLFVQN